MTDAAILSSADLCARIDHTLLKPEASPADVLRLCDEALAHGFASVCVNGRHVRAAAGHLRGRVKVCGVAGFPLGAMKPMVKAIEAASLVKDGASEVDFVASLPALLACDADEARAEFIEITKNVRAVLPSVTVKVILETAALLAGVSADQGEARIAAGCLAARESGCDFVKTSTGFHAAGGATELAVQLLKKHAGPLQVKASGGIRTAEDARRMLAAGATRLGCSSGVAIATGGAGKAGY